jgi:hypothetical protein
LGCAVATGAFCDQATVDNNAKTIIPNFMINLWQILTPAAAGKFRMMDGSPAWKI